MKVNFEISCIFLNIFEDVTVQSIFKYHQYLYFVLRFRIFIIWFSGTRKFKLNERDFYFLQMLSYTYN